MPLGAVVTDFVHAEIELGDRWAGLVVFWAMVTVPEPRQPRRPHDCIEEARGSLHTQLSLYVTKCALPAYRAHVFQQTLLKQQLAVEKVI